MEKLTLTIFFGCICTYAYTQNLLTNDNSFITIEEGVKLTIQGDASTTGTMLNEGEIILSGNWSNNGIYSSTSGTFMLNGENQIIEPGQSTYSNFILNSTGVVATSDLNINQSLNLISGILSISNGASLLMGSEAVVVGGDEDSYIDGTLFTSAQGDFTFPTGTETEFLPVSLSGIQSTNPVGIKAFNTQINASSSLELSRTSPTRYWQILDNSTFTANNISLPLVDDNFIDDEGEATIAFTSDLTNPIKSVGTSTISGSLISGSIQSESNIVSGYYVLAQLGDSEPPIKVINIVTALQDGKHDFLRIENIEFYENNKVEIFDRSGTKVFEMSNYNNVDRVFRGTANVRNTKPLTTGSYFYTVQFSSKKRESGFIYLKN